MPKVNRRSRFIGNDQFRKGKKKIDMKILIVDDDRISRLIMRKLLEEGGFDILEAENGNEGLRILETEPVDLIISDLMMPDMDGLEMVRRIKENDITKHINVIVVSASGEKEMIVKSAALGIEGFILKPVDANLLRQKVKNSLKTAPQILNKKATTIQRLGMNFMEYKELLQSFIDDSKKNIDSVRHFIEKGDGPQARIASNTIKGAAASIGALKIRDAAQRLEDILERGDIDNAEKILTIVGKEFEVLRKFALNLEQNWL